jgi:hypothetical protein
VTVAWISCEIILQVGLNKIIKKWRNIEQTDEDPNMSQCYIIRRRIESSKTRRQDLKRQVLQLSAQEPV